MSAQQSAEIALLRTALNGVRDALRMVDEGAPEDQIQLLKELIHKSFEASNQASATSLEKQLERIGLPQRIAQSRVVLEIDKLGKYLQLCDHLLRLSRQPRTRSYCRNLNLEVCTAYSSSRPVGSDGKCHVHGEVQLILFYERNPTLPPPRAIGSSKSACLLCDSFIRKYGRYGISRSHMNLYSKWTIPECAWMSSDQRRKFRDIIKAMDFEIVALLKKPFYHNNIVAESKAQIPLFEQSSDLASSLISSVVSDSLQAPDPLEIRLSSASSSTVVPDDHPLDDSNLTYQFEDLPITVNILSSTNFCELTAGIAKYLFDFDEMGNGMIQISNITSPTEQNQEKRLNATELSLNSSVCVQAQPDSQNLTFFVHCNERHELRVTVTWKTP